MDSAQDVLSSNMTVAKTSSLNYHTSNIGNFGITSGELRRNYI